MKAESLHDLYLEQLKDLYDAEHQLIKALPKMAKAASSSELRGAFEEHLEVTRGRPRPPPGQVDPVAERAGERRVRCDHWPSPVSPRTVSWEKNPSSMTSSGASSLTSLPSSAMPLTRVPFVEPRSRTPHAEPIHTISAIFAAWLGRVCIARTTSGRCCGLSVTTSR